MFKFTNAQSFAYDRLLSDSTKTIKPTPSIRRRQVGLFIWFSNDSKFSFYLLALKIHYVYGDDDSSPEVL